MGGDIQSDRGFNLLDSETRIFSGAVQGVVWSMEIGVNADNGWRKLLSLYCFYHCTIREHDALGDERDGRFPQEFSGC